MVLRSQYMGLFMRYSLIASLLVLALLMPVRPASSQDSSGGSDPDPEPDKNTTYLGSILYVANSFCPRGFAAAQGQLLEINDNTALFSVIGVTYGGDGRVTFALPDLRGREAIGTNDTYFLGQMHGTGRGMLPPDALVEHRHGMGVPPLAYYSITARLFSVAGANDALSPVTDASPPAHLMPGVSTSYSISGQNYAAYAGSSDSSTTVPVELDAKFPDTVQTDLASTQGSNHTFMMRGKQQAVTACISTSGVFPNRE